MLIPVLAVIVALGDSVTLGVRRDGSVPVESTFVAVLEQRLGEKVVNAGIGGNNTSQMLERIDRDVLAHKPRIVIIMAGLNDAAYVDAGPKERTEPRIPLAVYEKNLGEIAARVRQTGARPIIVTPNPMTAKYPYANFGHYRTHGINDPLTAYADAARQAAKAAACPLVDLFADWIARPGHVDWLPDGIHPNPEGHRRIADLIEPALRQ